MRLGVGGAVAVIVIPAASVAHADSKPVTIDGVVKQEQPVTGDALRLLPAVERRVTFETDHGPQAAT